MRFAECDVEGQTFCAKQFLVTATLFQAMQVVARPWPHWLDHSQRTCSCAEPVVLALTSSLLCSCKSDADLAEYQVAHFPVVQIADCFLFFWPASAGTVQMMLSTTLLLVNLEESVLNMSFAVPVPGLSGGQGLQSPSLSNLLQKQLAAESHFPDWTYDAGFSENQHCQHLEQYSLVNMTAAKHAL